MVNGLKNNYYINAPAGSGKTYFIENKIKDILTNQERSKILCVTYTNRAADEMKERIKSNNVDIGTIHSFINQFLKPFYPFPESKELYYEMFENEIHEKVNEHKTSYYEKNNLSTEINFSKEMYLSNLQELFYNEKNYNFELSGGLSHDNLLLFAWNLLDKYPILKTKLSGVYNYIFIDEVQDTSSNILSFFYNSLKETDVELFFLGDKMQEIYENYDGSFEEYYEEMDIKYKENFGINYRSSNEIVTVLNNLYLSSNYQKQISNNGNNGSTPKVYIVDSQKDFLTTYDTENYLTLRLNNRRLFENNDLEKDITEVYNLFYKIYPYGSKVSAKDILLPSKLKNENQIIYIIYLIHNIKKLYENKQHGKVIELIRNSFYSNFQNDYIFNKESFKISNHIDKINFNNKLLSLTNKFTLNNTQSLKEFFIYLYEDNILSEKYCEYLNYNFFRENPNILNDHIKVYKDIIEVKLSKFIQLCELNDNINISTQHGVKGEGHNSIIFVAEKSSSNPRIDIDKFLKLISTYDNFNFDEFQSFYYDYLNDYNKVLELLKINSYKDIKLDLYESNKEPLEEILEKYKNNAYFKIIKEDKYEYFTKEKPGVGRYRDIFRLTELTGALQAYKLFYVGCSRAIDKLVIVVEQSLINGFDNEFIEKFEAIGFEIENEQDSVIT